MKILLENFNKFLAELAEAAIGDYQIIVDETPWGWRAKVMLGAEEIGILETEPLRNSLEPTLQVLYAEVDEAHQGKGIGSAMYDELEKQSGMKLVHGDISQSPGALKLWRKRLGETDEWMLNYYIDGLYSTPGKIEDRLGLPYGSENYTDEQVEQIAREDLGL